MCDDILTALHGVRIELCLPSANVHHELQSRPLQTIPRNSQRWVQFWYIKFVCLIFSLAGGMGRLVYGFIDGGRGTAYRWGGGCRLVQDCTTRFAGKTLRIRVILRILLVLLCVRHPTMWRTTFNLEHSKTIWQLYTVFAVLVSEVIGSWIPF